MLFKKLHFFLLGLHRRSKLKGVLITFVEMLKYVRYYNQILLINGYKLSVRRRISHFLFYSRISYLYPNLDIEEMRKIVPRSLTHSVYEKFKIKRSELTFDKLKMYQKMIESNISIPKTYYFDKNTLVLLGDSIKNNSNGVEPELILKPRFSNGGEGIRLIKKEEIKDDYNSIFQEVMLNHQDVLNVQGNNFCSTLRYVFYNSSMPSPIGASFQFNTGKIIDHMMQGGSLSILVNVETGRLFGKAFSYKGETFEKHPLTGVEFANFQLPNWNLVNDEIKKIAKAYPSLPIIAADLCISEYGCVVLEINAGCGTIAGQLDRGWLHHTFFSEYYPKRPTNL